MEGRDVLPGIVPHTVDCLCRVRGEAEVKLVIGGIIHDREGIPELLDAYLGHVARLRTGGMETEHVWVVDSSNTALRHAILNVFPEVHLLGVKECCPSGHYKRGVNHGHSAYKHLAELRNTLAQETLRRNADALLSVDSDILVPANLVQMLATSKCPWVAALVRNRLDFLHLGTQPSDSIEDRWWNVFWYPWQEGRPVFAHFKPIGVGPDGTTWPTEVCSRDPQEPFHTKLGTGAVCWYNRELLEHATWETRTPSPGDPTGGQCRGEDVGFSIHALKAGFSASYVPLICDHIMDSKSMERHRTQCPICVLRT